MNQLDGWRESGTNPENMVLRAGGVGATVGRADNGEWWWTVYDEEERAGNGTMPTWQEAQTAAEEVFDVHRY